MILYRLAKISDTLELRKLNDSFNGEGCNTLKAIEESLKYNKQEIVYVAAAENMLVGYCCGQILKSMCYSYNYGEITELYVREEYRQQGIGRQLMMRIESEFRRHGVNHLHLLTDRNNSIAQALYRSCGFNDTSEILFEKNFV